MTWGLAFRVRQQLKGSLWVLPLIGALVGGVLGSIAVTIDPLIQPPPDWQYSPATATAVVSAIVGASVALTGFVVTVSVLVVQMSTGTFSARYMRLWYRDRMLKWVLAILVGTLTFSFTLLRNTETDFVPDLGVWAAGVLMTTDLILFVLFFDHFLHRLRPVAVATIAARAGREAFAQVIRSSAAPDAPSITFVPYEAPGEPTAHVVSESAGSIQAVDGSGLVRYARAHDCLIVLPYAVGDFVSGGGVLMEIYGGTRPVHDDDKLRGMVALGAERTIEQDPAFAIRVMVDIACRALSAAVNDPTTATQVLDHLGDLLRHVGAADVQVGEATKTDQRVWVMIRARPWPDLLAMGVTEIRIYGGGSMQVVRRMRALLDELAETVQPANRAAVLEELRRLDATVATHFAHGPDADRARVADRQGISG